MVTQSNVSKAQVLVFPSCYLNYLFYVFAEQALGARKAEGEKISSEPC